MAKPVLEPIQFVPVEMAFEPQVKVRATRDMSGWVDRGKKSGKPRKWEIRHGRIGTMDASTARDFQAKGFVEILEGKVEPVSEQEAAELLGSVHTISIGGPNSG